MTLLRVLSKHKVLSMLVCWQALSCCHALENGQALTPPMGWLSWERFRCNTDCRAAPDDCISENLIKSMADRLAEDGFAKAGYNVVGIDDCWLAKERDERGRLQPDATRFPSGMKALANYIHDRGLQFGIYGDIGSKTCGGFPGMAGSLQLDAETYAEWGVDYLKVDGCYADPKQYAEQYPLLGKFLNQTGRAITYSCSWPAYLPDPTQTAFQVPYDELKQYCNLWRNWNDIQDSWDSLASILVHWAQASQMSKGFQQVVGPGAWNDPDMIIIGNKGLKGGQNQVQFGMWAVFAAPLLMSNDLRRLRKADRMLLLDPTLIEINQDPLGIQGELVECPGGCDRVQLWYRKLQRGRRALAFLNVSLEEVRERQCITWKGLGWAADTEARVVDVFSAGGSLKAVGRFCIDSLQPTSLAMYVAQPESIAAAES